MLNLYLPFLTTISGSINSLEICITVDKFNILTTEIWYVHTFFVLYHFSITTGNIYLELNVQKKAYGIGVTEGFFFDSDFLCLEIYFYEGNKILSVFQFFSSLTIFLIAVVRMLILPTPPAPSSPNVSYAPPL